MQFQRKYGPANYILLLTLVMDSEMKRKYCNIKRQTIEIYLLLCKQSQFNKTVQRNGLEMRPILTNEINSHCRVDLIGMQSEPDQYFHSQLHTTHIIQQNLQCYELYKQRQLKKLPIIYSIYFFVRRIYDFTKRQR